MLNVNIDDEAELWPNELIQYAPITCPCLSSTVDNPSDERGTDLETIINRNDTETSDDRKLSTDRSIALDFISLMI